VIRTGFTGYACARVSARCEQHEREHNDAENHFAAMLREMPQC
jgi:hypothetical protein